LIACAHGGGNYLLNIGPKADGSVPAASVRILTRVGERMKKNGEAVYGTDKCPVWGSCFSQFTTRGKDFYINLYSWPGETWGTSDFRAKVKSATFLATGEKIAFDQNKVRLKFTGMPRKAPDSPITVIKLELAAPARIDRDRDHARSLKPRGPVCVPQ